MIETCYSKLALKPKKTTALLFYSQVGGSEKGALLAKLLTVCVCVRCVSCCAQLGDGKMDDSSLHGACPGWRGALCRV